MKIPSVATESQNGQHVRLNKLTLRYGCIYIDHMETKQKRAQAEYNSRGDTKMASYRMPVKTLETIDRLAKERQTSKVQVLIDGVERLAE